VQLVF